MTMAWTLVEEMDHGAPLVEGDPVTCRAVVYLEERVAHDDLDTRLAIELGGGLVHQSRYQTVNERPIELDVVKPDPRKSELKAGVSKMQWSGCGRDFGSTRCTVSIVRTRNKILIQYIL